MATTIRIRNNLPALQQFLTKDSSSILKAGAFLEAKIVEKIAGGNIPPPLTAKTIAAKGSSATLIDTGELLSEITTKQIDNSSVGVGIYGSRAEIGAIHEWGAQSKNIPERSFLRSTANENKDTVAEVFGANLKLGIEKAVLK